MNKILFGLALALVSCVNVHAQDERSFTQKMLKPLVSSKCTQELKNSKLWYASTLFFSQEKKNQLQHNICDCVGDNALQDVGMKELTQAMLNEEAKSALVQKAVINSLNACALNKLK